MPLSTASCTDDDLVTLERELNTSRANEEASRAALQQLHKNLHAAYLKISRQEQKIEALARKLRPDRGANLGSSVFSFDDSLMVSRLADLAHPHNFCHTLVEGTGLEAARPPIRLQLTSAAAAARVKTLWPRLPAWTTGCISGEDAGFLGGLIDAVRPDQVYEVGVASGASSALILSSMADHADAARIWLHSYDIAAACYFDSTLAVGDATRAMVPALLEQWKLNTRTTALDVPHGRPAKTRSLYFIDANHSHPWPAFDLIALLPGLQPGDQVVLHDIDLPAISDGKFPDYGAKWLFDDWLGDRVRPDVARPNIGALVIPEDRRVVVASLVKTLSRAWATHVKIDEDHLLACEKLFLAFLSGNHVAPAVAPRNE